MKKSDRNLCILITGLLIIAIILCVVNMFKNKSESYAAAAALSLASEKLIKPPKDSWGNTNTAIQIAAGTGDTNYQVRFSIKGTPGEMGAWAQIGCSPSMWANCYPVKERPGNVTFMIGVQSMLGGTKTPNSVCGIYKVDYLKNFTWLVNSFGRTSGFLSPTAFRTFWIKKVGTKFTLGYVIVGTDGKPTDKELCSADISPVPGSSLASSTNPIYINFGSSSDSLEFKVPAQSFVLV